MVVMGTMKHICVGRPKLLLNKKRQGDNRRETMAKREETLSDGTVVVRYWTLRHLTGGFVLPGDRLGWHTMRLYDTRQVARDVKRPLFERVKKVWVEE